MEVDMSEAMESELEGASEVLRTTTDVPDVESNGESSNDKEIVWNEDVEEEMKLYLLTGSYPARCQKKEEKRIFRRRAQQFVVVDYQLYYLRKKKGRDSLLITLTTKEEQNKAFQVGAVTIDYWYVLVREYYNCVKPYPNRNVMQIPVEGTWE